jgi:uncharacterized protein (TIGR02996 family)
MAVYFVYRCHYGNPSEKHVRRFEADTVLDWFRSAWKPIADPDKAHAFARKLVGCRVYSLGSLFEKIAENAWAPPATMRQLTRHLHDALYVGEMKAGPHHVQIATDDDELEMAVYVFDDHYRAAHPGKADFLLNDGWQLPDGAGDGAFATRERNQLLHRRRGGDGRTYLAFLAFYDSGNLDDLAGGFRFDGVRLPDFPRVLLAADPDEDEWPRELVAIRTELQRVLRTAKGEERGFLVKIGADPGDDLAWGAYSDWLQDRGEPSAAAHLLARALRAPIPDPDGPRGNPKRDLIHAGEHVAQACKYAARWDKDTLYHQWLLFDDRWAAAYPGLADGILRFAARWDVL